MWDDIVLIKEVLDAGLNIVFSFFLENLCVECQGLKRADDKETNVEAPKVEDRAWRFDCPSKVAVTQLLNFQK